MLAERPAARTASRIRCPAADRPITELGDPDPLQRVEPSSSLQTDEAAALGFEERFGLLVDAEWTAREQRKLQRRLRAAKAAPFPHARGRRLHPSPPAQPPAGPELSALAPGSPGSGVQLHRNAQLPPTRG